MDEERWEGLEGGYRIIYDPRPALERLRGGDTSAWAELFQELHHQGDVGLASYAAVPPLIQIHRERNVPAWQTYGLVGTIELYRHVGRNPKLPDWLAAEYLSAWGEIIPLATRDLPRTDDQTTVSAILGALAIAKGLKPLGEIMLDFTVEEVSEMVEIYKAR